MFKLVFKFLILPLFCIYSAAVSAFCLFSDECKTDEKVQFIVLGDIPYDKWGEKEQRQLNAMKDEIPSLIADEYQESEFSIFLGDFVTGGTVCSDEIYEERKKLIANFQPGKTVYIPGDNEWVDCDTMNWNDWAKSKRKHRVMQKDRLVSVFYGDGGFNSYPEAWNFENQSEQSQVENQRWMIKNVLFLTLHIVGGNNGWANIGLDDNGNDLKEGGDFDIRKIAEEIKMRDKANLDWLDSSLVWGLDRGAEAIVIFTHADIKYIHKTNRALSPIKDKKGNYKELVVPDRNYYGVECTEETRDRCDPYMNYEKKIVAVANTMADDDKPVILINGSTPFFCLDNNFFNLSTDKGIDSLQKTSPKNLWQFNAWGDLQTEHADASLVTIDLGDKENPISAFNIVAKEKGYDGLIEPQQVCDDQFPGKEEYIELLKKRKW